MKIIFASNGDIGTELLKGLFVSNHEIVVVYTNEPIESGRKTIENPVYSFAKEKNIPIKSPKTFKNNDVRENFLEIKHDIVIVASYGFLLPEWFLNAGKFCAINLHPSSLPKYRGAAPVQRAIEHGEKSLNLCVIFMTKELDAGDILAKISIEIGESENAGDIFKKIDKHSSILILKALDLLEKNEIKSQKQEGDIVYAKKIDKSELFLDLQNLDVISAFNKIRAFSENGNCYILYKEERIKILTCDIKKVDVKPGLIGEIDEKFNIYLYGGILVPKIVQRQGKNAVKIEDFLRGWRP